MQAGRRHHSRRPLLSVSVIVVCFWAVLSFGQGGGAAGSFLCGTAFSSLGQAGQAGPPIAGLLAGFALYFLYGADKNCETAAIVMIYFGAQTGMNLYVKALLTTLVIDEEEGIRGVPIGFLITAIQQFVAFGCFCTFLVGGRVLDTGYKVKRLRTRSEYLAVVGFSMTFAFNIGLNNFSLSFLSISVNLIIRSCLPLSTALSQMVVGQFVGVSKPISQREWLLMFTGVSCATVAIYVKNQGVSGSSETMLGICCCVASIFSGALNMVLAGVFGTVVHLNALDTTCYMALPAAVVLLMPALLFAHPTGWPGHSSMTDVQVLLKVLGTRPSVMGYVLISGVLAFMYNVLQYALVQRLSPTYTAFAGNFNKAATVALALLLGVETLPANGYDQIFLFAILGNIVAFTAYSLQKEH